MGFFLLFALLINDLKHKIQPILFYSLFGAIIIFWGITSIGHHTIAQTQINYLQHWLRNSPNNLLPRLMLGHLYANHPNNFIPEELIEEMLNSDADLEKVLHEDSMARKIGINGVPTFLIGGKVLVNGAQDAEHLAHVIDRVAAESEDTLATG